MAWVNIGTHPLLASIQSRPAPGSHLTFIIQKLTPEIILKEVFEGSQAGLPVFDLIKEFNALRTVFEKHSEKLWDQKVSLEDETAKRRFFLDALRNDAKSATAYHEVTACAARINAFLGELEVFAYWPWLHPNARSQSSLVRMKRERIEEKNPFYEVVHEFESYHFGMVQINTLYRFPQVGYRILAQHLPQNISLKEHFTSLAFPKNIEARCLGIERLPANKHGGILSELLLPSR